MAHKRKNKTPGAKARDRALANVAANSGRWMDRAIVEIGNMRRVRRFKAFLGEDIRMFIEPAIGAPHKPNVYGALTHYLRRVKIIKKTRRYRPMKDVSSHARMTPEYAWVKLRRAATKRKAA